MAKDKTMYVCDNCGQESVKYIVITARRDPGRYCVIAGIWMIIAGVAILCWFSQSHMETSRDV